MPLPEQYLVTTKNLSAFFNAVINAQAPQKVTQKFLEQLEFKSTNDRLIIGVLKALKFIDASGTPTEIYYQFLDQTQSKHILAQAIKDAYSDLFAVNKLANEMTVNEVKNKLKTLLQGSKSENVLSLMANTFHALCEYADFTKTSTGDNKLVQYHIPSQPDTEDVHSPPPATPPSGSITKNISTEMHYNIQIHLPETRDSAVFDAIFRSLKEHLL